VLTEAGLYLRLIDFCITQLKAQGPSRICNESKEEEEDLVPVVDHVLVIPLDLVPGYVFGGLGFKFQASGFRFQVSG
jgi:hypothetical protein